MMSCRIDLVADCGDIYGISRSLYISDKDDPDWLSHCCISLSSCGSLLCFSYKNRLCLLSPQWISATESTTYIISWNGNLPNDATALLAVSIRSSSLSSQNGADWVCIIVGYKNGEVDFYTNTGHLLLTEKLDTKPIVSLDCHTGSYGSDTDDIRVLFQSSVCILSGSTLFQTLRFAKAQLARVQAGVITEFSLDGKNILPRKWQFVDQDVINDATVVGLELKNTYDHLLAASSFGGYDTWYRSIPPHNTLVVGVGARPYIGFHYALEGGTSPPLHDVARAVASKIKSALPGWLGGGTKSTTNETESKVREENLSMRSGIGDVQRHATAVVLSPDRRLAAVTDNLGRIAILHLHRGCLIRLFKGYRDSQCAFMQVFDHDSNRGPLMSSVKDTRKATFLIIYNPKKGIVDIRLMQRGSRVATFTATKNGKLLYNTSGLVGSKSNYSHKKLNLPVFSCVLLDPDGKIKKFVIPFHNALEGENSQRSKDLHVIMELKNFIKQKTFHKEDLASKILKTAKELKLPDLKRHCLELTVEHSEVPPVAVMSCVNFFKQDLESKDHLTLQDIKLKQFCDSLECVTLFFLQMSCKDFPTKDRENNDDKNYDVDKKESTQDIDTKGSTDADMKEFTTDVDIKEPTKDFGLKQSTEDQVDEEKVPKSCNNKTFSLLEIDTIILKRLLELAHETVNKDSPSTKVTFADHKKSIFKDFVTSFDLDNTQDCLELKRTTQGSCISALASYLFKPMFEENYPEPASFGKILECSKITPMVMVKLLITHCMEMSLNKITLDVIQKFIEILYYICQASEEAKGIVYNEISLWWQNIRNILVDMPCPLRTMVMAMVCRAVSQMIEQHSQTGNVDDAWVSLTAENAKWSMLIGKLEDISMLSIVLQFKTAVKGKSLPKLKAFDLEINLKYIYNRGKGSVSEHIAKWLCSKGVTPEAIWANEVISQIEGIESEDNVKISKERESRKPDEESGYLLTDCDRMCVEENPLMFKWLNLLKKQFPYSASSNNLIANIGWEYAAAWQRDINDMEKLAALISCLNNITNIHLCLGLCTLIWMTYMKEVFESTCRLVNKVGKLPKERLSLQDVGLKDAKIFLELCTKYLERFLYCEGKANETEKQTLQFEKIWDESIPALVEVAQDTDKINHSILNLTYQIACAIYYQCNFNIKISKPLNTLFDCDLQYVFAGMALSEETAHELNLRYSDGKLRNQRMKFLTKVVVAALELISCEDTAGREIVYRAVESWAWMEKIFALAELWHVDSNFIRREQIVGLYKLGYDTLAEDTIATVQEPELLLEPLVRTCAKRLKRCLEVSKNVSNVLAALPPELAVHLQTMESDSAISANISLKTTASVLANVMCRVQNNKANMVQQNLRLAELMIYGCDILQEFNETELDEN